MYNSKIRTFTEVDSFSANNQWKVQIRKKIESETKEYILRVDEEEYINFLIEDFKVIPLVIYEESEQIEHPKVTKEKMTDRFRGYEYEQDVYVFTATGETFNKNGKTDIILKYSADNTNLFVAECKFWKGPSEFHQAINQLFDRYLTWRDSKVALMFFVQNKDFTKVLETVKEEAKKHSYFKKVLNYNGESTFSYVYRLPNDEDKDVFLEIILFHFDQK